MASSSTVSAYNHHWPADASPLEIEFAMIRSEALRKVAGTTLFQHYRSAQSIAWPEDDHHRWSDLLLKSFCDEEISILLGCGDSGKTFGMAKFILIDYWSFAEETLWLISSTELRGAELRVFGKVKELFNRARRRFPWLPGKALDYLHTITTAELTEGGDEARAITKGIILVPMKRGSTAIGLAAYVGIKCPRLRHAGDEVQHAPPGFLDAYANWYGKENFKGLMAGNPLDPNDPLCTAAEPAEGGWDNFVDNGKTQDWRSSFFGAHVIALDGRDSPNFDFPGLPKPRFPYLISKKKLDAVEKTFGQDSWQWYNQCVGKPNKGVNLFRVLTRQLCEQHHALEEAVWSGNPTTSVYGLDPNYGGDDRCVGIKIEFGEDSNKQPILSVGTPDIIPVKANSPAEPEDQIANYIKNRLANLAIPVSNCFYDSTGKGTLGFAFARVFGATCPVPVDFGDKPSTRPVRHDLFMVDMMTRARRLKRCDEHYSKFVTELWFSVREVIEADQMRNLPQNVMQEGCLRIYRIVSGSRIEVEPKRGTPNRPGMRERVGFSPDLFDSLAVAVEGARRLGFKILRLGNQLTDGEDSLNWLGEWKRSHERLINEGMLAHTP